ncbi:carbohydrate-binding protein [Actinomadura logoneensis]|uniref:carbohydrate-binding protein n=1 Tax=Actinomadura logoneensis TaxID=2293572 RepID=UPI001314E779|nr:carbohydrate-binding protein [Actinomadura logoneensis]
MDAEPAAAHRPPRALLDLAAGRRQRRGVLHLLRPREAFYTCSDLDFGGANQPGPPPTTPPPTTPPPTTPPTTPPTQQPGDTWTAGKTYAPGDRVAYGGAGYTCLQGHTAIAGWEPPNAPALWRAE